jgi:hypothetical protein
MSSPLPHAPGRWPTVVRESPTLQLISQPSTRMLMTSVDPSSWGRSLGSNGRAFGEGAVVSIGVRVAALVCDWLMRQSTKPKKAHYEPPALHVFLKHHDKPFYIPCARRSGCRPGHAFRAALD